MGAVPLPVGALILPRNIGGQGSAGPCVPVSKPAAPHQTQ